MINVDEGTAENLIAAGIVLYKPNFERLFQNIQKLSRQINTVILYNNGADITRVEEYVNKCSCSIVITGDGENKGIAAALNGIMEKAEELGYSWALTLDQDSIVPANMIPKFSKVIESNDVAVVCPQNIDSRRKYMIPVSEPEIEVVKMCDTSGSCTNVSIWRELGGFDEWLFIDLVDNDYCKRVDLKGYQILKLNSVIMDHQYGVIESRGWFAEKFFLKAGKMLHNTNIAKLSFKRKVNPMRIYYENRNVLYLNKKYKNYGGVGYSNHHCKTYVGFFITFSLYSWLVSDKKGEVYRAIKKGIRDGKDSNPAQWVI